MNTDTLVQQLGKTRLVGLMDKASAFGAEDCGFESHIGRYF